MPDGNSRKPLIHLLGVFLIRFIFGGLYAVCLAFSLAVAGWMLCGISGYLISWALLYITGRDLNETLPNRFAVGGIYMGAVIGLWLSIGIFKRNPRRPAPDGDKPGPVNEQHHG